VITMVRIAHRCELCDGDRQYRWHWTAIAWIGDDDDGFWACEPCRMGQDLIWWMITGAKPIIPPGHVDPWPPLPTWLKRWFLCS